MPDRIRTHLITAVSLLAVFGALRMAQASEYPFDIKSTYLACTDRKGETDLRLGSCTSLISFMEAAHLTRAEFRLRDVYVSRADLYHQQGRNREALSDLQQAIVYVQFADGKPVPRKMAVWPEYYAYLLRGQVQFDLGRYEAAILSLQEAGGLTDTGKSGKSERKRVASQIDALTGAAYGRIGRMSEALAAVNRAIDSDHGSARAYRVRSDIYKALGQADAAAADAARAAELSD